MSHQPASSFDQLIAILGKKVNLTGGEELKLTGTEIADILWLILQGQESAETTPAVVVSLPKNDTTDIILPTPTQLFSDKNPTPLVQKSPSVDVYHSGKLPPSINPSHSDKPSRDSNTLPIKTPDAKSLRDSTAIIRALRPLVQRIAVGRRKILDEQATAERIAEEQGIPIPVLKSAQELAFNLALVVDESNSMIFWRQTIEELQQLLKKSGVFRDVQIWGLVTDNQEEIYLQRGIGKKAHHRRCSPCEVLGSSGRHLILVVSDCVSAIWHNGKALSVLEIWVKQNAVAIVQMLPESMWLRTGLTLGAKVQLGNSILGAANQRLFVKEVLLWNDIKFDRGIKVPVLTLEPDMIETWSEMLVGKGTIGAGGFVFTSPPKAQKPGARSVKDAEPKNFPSQEFETKENLTSEERVYRFRMTASPMAQNLASLLSSAPVITLPVVRIIQETLLSMSQQIHVAEVFLGGILKPLSPITPKTHPDGVEYIFIDDDKDKKIRDFLLKNSLRTESLQVIDAVSKYLAENIGNKSLKDFYALLKKPKELDAAVEEAKKNKKEALDSFDSKRFAEITTKVLKRLGGAYARFAKEIEQSQYPQVEPPKSSVTNELIQYSPKKFNNYENDFPEFLENHSETFYT
ncbi:SAV_2336 N-terminal domain-related protein [Nostoc sp. ATCC 53789]|uniref:SAV_2336 N-terminal domain-related protein n=1 Tax=Nostoc sp. ATCC 53789 TaxID=76335 RepID=UPI000DEC46CF|nr:SAV_2336 N-terminal domain-related protein [Nostoc sp. ATCC 53789]QHG20715.1 hypothetical protein GJB62_33190 [Nostoc sp. ATCC 53789]RCJ15467.1 hypothetical protein A6V25_32535 [Nostoc sp. ATCC 53789]